MTARFQSVPLAEERTAGSPFQLLLIFGGMAVFAMNNLVVAVSLVTIAFIWIGAFASPFRTVMSACLSYQWLQVTMQVWLAELYRVDLSIPQAIKICNNCVRDMRVMAVTTTTEQTVILSLAGLLMLLLGTRMHEPRMVAFHPLVKGLSVTRLLIGYLFLLLLSRLVGPFTGGGLAQPLIFLGSLRFVFAVLLIYLWFSERRGLAPLLAVFTIEIVAGFTGFFSGFKEIFVVCGMASLTIANFYWKRMRLLLIVGGPLLLLLGSVWTVIKPAYRQILNGGNRSQSIVIDFDQRLNVLGDMTGALDTGNIADGIIGLAQRMSYIEIPSYVLQRVPDIRPYEYGSLWGEAIKQVVMPRFLVPDKPILASDSVRTNRYTGKFYDSAGTSVSLGYLIESYIDFGFFGALIIPFSLGLIYALIARHILYLGGRYDLTFCVGVFFVLFLPVQQFEISNIKLFPSVLWGWIVSGFICWYVWPKIRFMFYAAPVA
jgi:hypothetical protein